MSNLVVIGYDNEHQAFEMRAALAKLQKVFWIAAIVILFSGYVYADDPRDANYWNRMDMGQKQRYVAGIFDGITLLPYCYPKIKMLIKSVKPWLTVPIRPQRKNIFPT